eukprot:GCRY01002172.1.p1 GENE.GCRY01002172.1~~GCRY01002172.1.p1  ORF type:complete len:234 (+),score=39.49 GCRY01002172.1:79-780(+)
MESSDESYKLFLIENIMHLRKDLLETVLKLNNSDINRGTSGNVSMRVLEQDGFLITPSGVPYDEMKPEDLVFVKMDGSYEHPLKPSSEWRFHRDIYLHRKDVGAVVHAHPTHSTVLACACESIPPFHYMIAVSGDNYVRVAPYATFGSAALSESIVGTLGEHRTVCLMQNHGLVATGSTPAKALGVAIEVEGLAEQYLLAKSSGVQLTMISVEEMARIHELFKSYGQQPNRKE